jgi:hypothetical protein
MLILRIYKNEITQQHGRHQPIILDCAIAFLVLGKALAILHRLPDIRKSFPSDRLLLVESPSHKSVETFEAHLIALLLMLLAFEEHSYLY